MKVLQVKIEPMKIKNALKGFNKWKEGDIARAVVCCCRCFSVSMPLFLLFSVVVVVKGFLVLLKQTDVNLLETSTSTLLSKAVLQSTAWPAKWQLLI